MKRMYLALGLVVAIAACNSPSTDTEATPDATSNPSTTEVAEPAETSPAATSPAPSQPTDAAEQTEAASPVQDQTASPSNQGKSDAPEALPSASVESQSAQSEPAKVAASPATPSASATPDSPTPEPVSPGPVDTKKAASPEPKPEKAAVETVEIAIDETVCGTGGQEAYFETRKQEIYICRSENETLTYIATPKKKGNSVFLPATAIPDGDKTAYLAEDGDRRFLVGPVGYRLEENGKAVAQEKVIRSR